MIHPRILPSGALYLVLATLLMVTGLLQPVTAGAQDADNGSPPGAGANETQTTRPVRIQDFEAPAARHVLSRQGLAPLYHAALLPFLERRTGYGNLLSNVGLNDDDPEVGEYGQGVAFGRVGTAFPVGTRYGVGFDAVAQSASLNVEDDTILDSVSLAISSSLGAHLFRGWAVGASFGVFASSAYREIPGPGLDDSDQILDNVVTGLQWSVGFGWNSVERNVSFGWRIGNPRYESGFPGDTPRNFVGYRGDESDGGEVLVEEIPTPMATEGFFRVAFMDNRLSFVLVSRREYHLGPDFGRVQDFSYLQRDIVTEYAITNRIAARAGYNRRDENYNEKASTSGQGALAGASFLAFNTIWDINLSYRQGPRTMAPWSGETISEFGVGLSLVRNW